MTPIDEERRADTGVRVIVAPTAEDLAREMRLIGCRDEGIRIMQPKGRFHLVRIAGVEPRAANIIKQEMLAHGGEAAVHWETVNCGIQHTAMLLMGTTRQFQDVCAHLRRQPFGLAGTAATILRQLSHLNTRTDAVLRCGRYALPLGRKTYVMGILNVTPDSFSGDGVADNVDAAVRHAERLLAEGADILDIGGESTRPGAEKVSLEEELRRVVPTVRALARFDVPISVDTYKSVVAREAVAAGATIINDISGLRFDPEMAAVAATAGVPVVVMHIKGKPRTMQRQPQYEDLMTEVCDYLEESTRLALAAGLPREQVILDPGFGFGKTVDQNLELIRRLRELSSYGQPVLLGTSRKSTIGTVLGGLPAQDRVEGTAATVAVGIANGADIVRVHDVQAMVRVARMTDAMVRTIE